MQGIRKGEEKEVVRETAHTRWTEGRLPLARARVFRVSCPSRIPFSFKRLPLRLAIDLFTVFFFTFDVDKLGKSVDTTGKTALILIKSPSFKVIRPRKVAKNVAVKFRDFDRGPISLLVFNNSLSD